MTRKGYRKDNMIKKLGKFIKKIPELPLQPEEIAGFGSILRDKEYIGDLDLIVKFDKESIERFEDFRDYFPFRNRYLKSTTNERYIDFYNFMIDIEFEVKHGIKRLEYERLDFDEQMDSENKQNEKISFQEYLKKNPTINNKIEKQFDIDTELLYYCSWTEVTGNAFNGKSIGDFQINIFFRRMFVGKGKGIRIYTGEDFRTLEPISIILWSKEKPDFKKNYQSFLQNRDEFFQKEFLNHLEILDKLIDLYKNGAERHPDEIGKEFKKAVRKLLGLKKEFQVFIEEKESERLNDLINDLRKKTKEVNEKIHELKRKHRIIL